jgi:hypothetical protein
MRGDGMLFVREDAVEAAWAIVEVSPNQVVHHLFCGQRSTSLNPGRVRCLRGYRLPHANAHQDLRAQ